MRDVAVAVVKVVFFWPKASMGRTPARRPLSGLRRLRRPHAEVRSLDEI